MNGRVPLVLLLGCVVLGACGNPTATSSAVPGSPSAPASPNGSPQVPIPTPTPPTCRLPIASGDAPVDGVAADGAAGHGGFLDLPAGTFSPDPASLGSYDRAISRWLPVARQWVVPEGIRYAWGDRTASVVHVIDAASGTDHPVTVPGPSTVIDFETEGVYVARAVPSSGAPQQGLGFIDGGTSAYRQITADGRWLAVGGGFAYGQDLDPAVPGPTGGPPGAANRVRKLDLRSGAVTTVASYTGASVQVLGVYGTEPLIAATAGAIYTVFVGASTIVFTGSTGDADPGGPVVIDGATVWFSSQNAAVWRWTGSGRATRAADVPLRSLQVAGACR